MKEPQQQEQPSYYITTPAERKPIKQNYRHVQFVSGTKFFRLPKPQSKRQLLQQQAKPSFFNNTTTMITSTSIITCSTMT